MKNWKQACRSGAALALAMTLTLGTFSGCGMRKVDVSPALQMELEQPKTFSVSYWFGDQLLRTQTVVRGALPEPLEFSRKGLVFLCWRDAAGTPAKPERLPITGDTAYFAGAYPDLSRHVPYLFPDATGRLRPDAGLTRSELAAAVLALAIPEAQDYLPELPQGEAAVTGEEFQDRMAELFSPEAAALGCLGLKRREPLTRSRAAAVLAELLGRECERMTPRSGAALPLDVTPDREDYALLLEAAVSHVPDASGLLWSEAQIPLAHAPGFAVTEGKLYYVLENGALLTNGSPPGVSLYFGPDGTYTCGNAELDELVCGILRELQAAGPGADREELLRAAYNYSRDSFRYLRKLYLPFGATDWEIESALEMLRTGMGNCYNYAAVFWALARGLGYDATAYSGTIGEDPHGWVEIPFDGVDYVYDPELEMADILSGYQNDRYRMSPMTGLQYGGYYRTGG